jgi:molybdopterin synthase sulfur carrier subunit
MAKIIIPTPLRKFTENQGTFEAQGQTVGDAIADLTATHVGLGKHLLDANQKLRSFIRVYVGDEDINFLQGEDTAVDEQTVISIVPAIAGGCY